MELTDRFWKLSAFIGGLRELKRQAQQLQERGYPKGLLLASFRVEHLNVVLDEMIKEAEIAIRKEITE